MDGAFFGMFGWYETILARSFRSIRTFEIDRKFGLSELAEMTAHSPTSMSVAALRRELGFTLAEMGERIGLSKSQMHEVERTDRASLRVALAIEDLSGARVDAAVLSEEVRAARHGLIDAAVQHAVSTGQNSQLSGSEQADVAP